MQEQTLNNNNDLIEIEKTEFEHFINYFKNYHLHLIIISSMLKRQGRMFADSREKPSIIIYNGKIFTAIWGPTDHELVELVFEKIPIHKMLFTQDDWIPVLKSRFKFTMIHKPNVRFQFDPNNLDLDYLIELRHSYSKKYKEQQKDIEFRLLNKQDVIPDYLWGEFGFFFENIEELLKNGFAFVAVDGNNNIKSIAGVPHIIYNNEFEVQIITLPEARKRGLGIRVAIELLIYSLNQGIVPRWDAANPLSANMALKLGYTNQTPYDMLIKTNVFIMLLRMSRIPKLIIWVLRKLRIMKN